MRNILIVAGGVVAVAAIAAGVYFGTHTGALYASTDEGDSWACIAPYLPPICSVETLVVSS